MTGVVDADTHIAECEAMWKYIDEEMHPRRPILAKIPDDTRYKERNSFWLIDGGIFPKPTGKASFSLITPSAQKKESGREDIHLAVRELTDPAARLRDMDKIGVEIQVIYPTLFLVYLTDDPQLDHIVIGSDYGHNDPSKESEFVKNMRAREDILPAVVEKILCHNARELYGLS
jgi:hypothetical protein